MALIKKTQTKILKISKLLTKEYGIIKPWKKPPIDTLIAVILSQNTSDLNSEKAFAKLKGKYKDWEELLYAKEKDIAKTIVAGGLANIKAKRIKTTLKQIFQKEGKLDLGFLRDYSPSQARKYLMQFDGVGPKSAAIVVAFAFEKPAFPIDTHILRVLERIPILPRKISYENAHEYMEAITPEKLKIPLHAQIITHGRNICKAQNPQCSKCIIRIECRRIGVKNTT